LDFETAVFAAVSPSGHYDHELLEIIAVVLPGYGDFKN
jgi:hypothetical protein